jgi:small subunit ribosomal protein S21
MVLYNNKKKILIFQKTRLYLFHMIIIDLKKEKNLESALRTYKYKVQRLKQVQNLRERQEFVKPSVKRRAEINKAIYVQKKKNGLDN